MPKKGLPVCECGKSTGWWLHKANEWSSRIMCKSCFRIVVTKSRRRHELKTVKES